LVLFWLLYWFYFGCYIGCYIGFILVVILVVIFEKLLCEKYFFYACSKVSHFVPNVYILIINTFMAFVINCILLSAALCWCVDPS
jgi:hypothetical protein